MGWVRSVSFCRSICDKRLRRVPKRQGKIGHGKDKLKKIAAYNAVEPSYGIPLFDLDSRPILDLAIDGAVEVDFLTLAKGCGGSHFQRRWSRVLARSSTSSSTTSSSSSLLQSRQVRVLGALAGPEALGHPATGWACLSSG
ncbi:hypothetical protein TIFTF001_027559 [Ficus carica]|uniref:Uncharacterized protein n=1 Tax=Ficus carica TaxID=3494 RepID=A0AA88DNA3_FICCA|nr:hypothetical protein TIFTF001_027559 [Ficus carica]